MAARLRGSASALAPRAPLPRKAPCRMTSAKAQTLIPAFVKTLKDDEMSEANGTVRKGTGGIGDIM